MFDPDYRRRGWNNSKYAPKNRRGGNITQTANAFALIVGLIAFFIASASLRTTEAFIVAAVVWFLSFIILGLTLRGRAERQIRQIENKRPKRPFKLGLRHFIMPPVSLVTAVFASFMIPQFQRMGLESSESALSLCGIQLVIALVINIAVLKLWDARSPLTQPTYQPDYIDTLPDPFVFEPTFPPAHRPATDDTFVFDKPNTQTPRDFEHEVAWLIKTLTGHRTEVVGGAGDGGIDVKVFDGNQLVGIIQCKRYDRSKALPPSFVRELYACKQRYRVKTAYLVTTARFTSASEDEARRFGIKLVDGDSLDRMRRKARENIGDLKYAPPQSVYRTQ